MYRFEKCVLKQARCYGRDYYNSYYYIDFKNSEGKNRKGYTYEYTLNRLKSYKPGQEVYISYDHSKKRGIRMITVIMGREEWEEHLDDTKAEVEDERAN